MNRFLIVVLLFITTLSFSQTSDELAQMEALKAQIAALDYNESHLDKVKAYFKQPDFKLVFDEMLAEGIEEAVFAQDVISKSYDQAVAAHGKEEIDFFIYGFLMTVETESKFKELEAQLDASLETIDASSPSIPVPFMLEHVALSVKDVDASALFYAKTFGLSEIVNRGEVDGIRWFSLGKDRELHLISTVKGRIITTKAVHFAVRANDFESFVMRIRDANIPYQDWAGTPNTISLRPDGVKQVYVQDPDGYWIEINSPRPKE